MPESFRIIHYDKVVGKDQIDFVLKRYGYSISESTQEKELDLVSLLRFIDHEREQNCGTCTALPEYVSIHNSF